MTAAVLPENLVELSQFLGFAPQHIFALVQTAEFQYVDAKIPKTSDRLKFREISIPSLDLKGVQKCILREILEKNQVSDQTYSYVKEKGIIDAARLLSGSKAVLKMDIENFFPSINSKRVFGLFESLGFNKKVSYLLTKLTTYKSCLAQGAPTSPYISNLVCRNLDNCLIGAAKSWDMNYLRYSDDIFFFKGKNFNHPNFTKFVEGILNINGFRPNSSKTKFYPKGVPRKTLGLLTHGALPAIPGPTRRRMRDEFFKGSRNISWGQENVSYLKGNLEWYKMVYGRDDKFLHYKTIIDGIEKLKFHFSYKSV